MAKRKFDPLIYALIDPVTNVVRYIGQSANGLARARAHSVPANLQVRIRSDRWVERLLQQGLKPLVEVVERCDVTALNDRERWWIAFGRAWGCDLTNLSDGGKTGTGWRASDATRAKIKRIQNDPKTKEKIRISSNLPGVAERQRRRLVEAAARPEVKEARRRGVIEAHKRPDVKERHRLGLIAAQATPEAKERRRQTEARPEVKAGRSKAQKRAQNLPETRQRHAATLSRPEIKAKFSAVMTASWADAAVRERIRLGMIAAWKGRRANIIPRIRINLIAVPVAPVT